MIASVTFRGERIDVEIFHDGGYEPDTNAHEIEWSFYGMTPEQVEALNVTPEEEDAIYCELCETSNDRLRCDDDVL